MAIERTTSQPNSKVTVARGTRQEIADEIEAIGASRIIASAFDHSLGAGWVLYVN